VSRFNTALEAARAPHQCSLMELAEGFYNAVAHVEAEDGDASRDPAVVLLGSFIAFHVHADVNSATGYRELLSSCEQRANTLPELQ
jgi:hypothetical protein